MKKTIQQFNNRRFEEASPLGGITIMLPFWKKFNKRQRFYFWTFIGGLLLALGVVLLVSLYNNRYNSSIENSLKDSKTLKTEEALKETAVSEINKLYELPADTEVIVGTITNIDELKKKQKYFEKGENGDLLLIYPDKTIIYDPVNKIVVDVANIKLMK